MKYAAAVGVAGFPGFAELNVCMLRKVFGPDIEVVIRDDRSTDSPLIEQVASKHSCYYMCDEVPLGHFAGDVQACIDALALGETMEADICIKMSQRAVVKDPKLKEIIEAEFRNPEIVAVLPGRPNPNKIRQGHQQYARFPVLTDMIFIRTGAITADDVKHEYEKQVKNGQKYYDCFVEVFWDKLRNERFPGMIKLLPEITDHAGGQPHLYLRRYQNTKEQYQELAESCGIDASNWDLRERAAIMRRYNPRPRM